ncbi:VWA domain-containing protein [Streptomyces poriticola]|uniref:VWA domain-containing protein n=1 Tax=Streptomyces poriticola TaxID=3120506 RepID=UPI002FCE2296
MGILTLLRNAFGRSRKARAAQAEEATQETAPSQERAADQEPAAPAPAADPAPATPPRVPSQPAAPEPSPAAQVPEPRPSRDEHDLVSAAFDRVDVTVPKPSSGPDAPKPRQTRETPPDTSPEPEPAPAPEPTAAPSSAATAQTPEQTPEQKRERDQEQEQEQEREQGQEPQSAPAPAPDPQPQPKLQPDPDPQPKPQPDPDPDPDPQPKPQPQPDPDPDPQQEATEPAAEPATQPAAEPAAADGDTAPQGPPAPDHASRTGGAGGNPEGEAEAPNPADATPVLTPARLRSRAPGLATAHKAAAAALKKHALTGARAKIYLVLDRSASMRPYYKDGSAQALAEQTLALAAHLDPDATVNVVFFSTELDGTGELTLSDHENKIDTLHAGLGRMGRTSYHAAVAEVIALHEKTPDPAAPALVVFQTDGAPDAKTPATQSLTDAAKSHPSVHFSFVAFGDPENKAFDYLRRLKTGNTTYFLAGETPRELTDKELYEGILASWRP